MGERDWRFFKEARRVRGGSQMAAPRLRDLDQASPPEAASSYLPVSRRGFFSVREVQGSLNLSGITYLLFNFVIVRFVS